MRVRDIDFNDISLDKKLYKKQKYFTLRHSIQKTSWMLTIPY